MQDRSDIPARRWLAPVVLAGVLAGALGISAVVGPDAVPTPSTTVTVDLPSVTPVRNDECERWVAGDGDDGASGTREAPWQTISHAIETVPLSGCVISVMPGVYDGARISRRFTAPTTLRSQIPYQATLTGRSSVVDVQGAAYLVVEGFEILHAGEGSRGVVVNIEDANGFESTWVEVRNNIIHDSFHDDLLKIRSGARHVTVSGNVFYNQGPREQHIDVNGVQDITIEDNIFSNDFAASGRSGHGDAKAFIVVKDSSGTGELGSRRVTIRRNIFMSYEGGREPLLQIGNDGKEYFEAIDIRIENNLLIGNSVHEVSAALGVAGVSRVEFVNNTVVGDMVGRAFAVHIARKRANPPNEDIVLANNVFADGTGTMGEFSGGVEGGVRLTSNLYWNAGGRLGRQGPVNPGEDPEALTADPGLDYDHSEATASTWRGDGFASGATDIRHEFERIVGQWGAVAADSPVVDGADPDLAPDDDILGRARRTPPDLGAWEAG